MKIDSGDLQEIDRISMKFLIKPIINCVQISVEFFIWFEIDQHRRLSLRSLVAQSIVYARNNGEFTSGSKRYDYQAPIELLDYVLLNNAVEGSADIIKSRWKVIKIQNSCDKMTMTPFRRSIVFRFSTMKKSRSLD